MEHLFYMYILTLFGSLCDIVVNVYMLKGTSCVAYWFIHVCILKCT